MWFKELVIRNVGPFVDCSHALTRGSIGVFGRNGRGKSTLLSLMYSVPTNDFSRFAGNKEECIRNTAPPKEESYVRGVIEHNGHTLDITRNLRVTKSRPGTVLIVDGGAPITDANKANAEIDRLLGVDRTLLNLYAFKAQDQIYDFLSTTPAARAKAYATLCRTEKCEVLWKMLGDYLNKDREVNVEIVDNTDELTSQAAAFQQELDGLTARITQHQEMLLNDSSYATANAILDRDRRSTFLAEQHSTEEEKEKALQRGDEAANAEYQRVEKIAKAKREYAAETEAEAQKARAALLSIEAYNAYRTQRKRYKGDIERLQAEHDAIGDPDQPDDWNSYEHLCKQSRKLEHEIDEAKRLVRTFESDKTVACPTCGTSVEHLTEHLNSARDKAKNGPRELRKLEDRIAAVDTYKTEVKRVREARAALLTRRDDAKRNLEGLQKVTEVIGDAHELKITIDEADLAKRAMLVADRAVQDADRARTRTMSELTACRDRLAKLAKDMAESLEPEERVTRAKRRLDEHNGAKAAIAKLEGEASGLRRQIKDREDSLKALKHRLKRSKRVKAMAAVATRARDVLHRDCLPRRVAQTNLSRMEEDINTGLGRFGDPFWVETSPDLTFTVHKPGEPPQPATFLSTGQRVILALSFWPAVASLWESDIGMLALDEPTANLDEENRRLLSQSLGAMAAKVRGRRQLVMVTHDHSLKTAFDQIIDLG